MIRSYTWILSILILIGTSSILSAQCTPCGSPTTFTVNLSANPDTTWTISSTRNGLCCGQTGTNCIRFNVTVHPQASQVYFNVVNPSPSGSAYYQVNCGPMVSIGTPLCLTNTTSFCLLYCKPGGDSPDYIISTSRGFQASSDITVRQGCSGLMTINGLIESSITWTSVSPPPTGQYNSYLSCFSGCDSTYVTPSSTTPSVIDYRVCGTTTGCSSGNYCDTVRVTVVPALTVSITPINPVICTPGPNVTITANPVGGNPPFSYLWSTGATTQSITVPVGTYTVSVGDNTSGCPSITSTVTVTSQPTPSAPTATSNSPICAGQTLNLFASNIPSASYNWTGPNSFSSTLQNPTIPNATTLASGIYSVTATVNGCTGPAGTVSVTVNPLPAAPTPSSNSPICAGQTLNLTSNLVPSATYNWTGPNSFSSTLQNPSIVNATTAASGIYTLTVTVGGCTSPTATTSVTVNASPAAPVATSNSPICAGQTLNLFASNIPSASYNWTGPNSFSSSLQNPTIPNATTLASGIYSVTATVAGCTGPAGTVSVTVNPIPAAPTPSSNSPVCAGQTLNLTSNLVPSATYSWTGPNSFSSALQNPSIVNATTAASGIYTLTVTVNGCTSPTATTSVTVNPTPAAPIPSSNSPICVGQTLNLTSNLVPSATYSWTGPNSFSSSLQNPSIVNATTAASGIYTLTVTVNGCTSPTATTSVVINATPVAPTISSNSPVCIGQTINLTCVAVPSATYSWTGPNSFSSALQNPSIVNAQLIHAGTYSLTVTVNGCTSPVSTTTVNVVSPPAAPTPSSNSPICAGQTLNLTSNLVPSATYNWTGPNSFSSTLQNPSIVNATTAASGIYTLTVTVGGCTSPTATTSVTVNASPAAPVASSNSPICAGQTLNLFASNIPSASYSWSGPNSFSSTLQNPTIPNATTLASGIYTVTATVAGCTGPAGTVSVTVNPIPAAPTPSSNSPVCAGQTLNLTSNLVPSATYSWTGPNSFSSALQNPSIVNVTTAASGIYTLTVTVAGCTSPTATTSVTVNPTPAAPTASSNSPVCSGGTLNLSATFVPSATYSWTGPNSFSSTLQNPSIPSVTTAASGVYTVTVTVNGCTSPTATTTVVINATPVAPTISSNSPVCIGLTINLTCVAVPSATYSWTGPNSFSSALQNPSIANAQLIHAGTYSLTVTVNGCTSPVSTTTVNVVPPPSAPTPSSNSPICAGQTLNLFSNLVPSATYNWTGPNSFSSTLQNPSIVNATTAASGIYTLTVTVGGCTSPTATTSVTVNPSPAAPTASSNTPVCVGNTLNLTATFVPSGTYSWTGPNSFSSSLQNPTIPSVTAAAAGIYTVTVTVNGCTSPTATTTVVINTPATVNAGPDQTVCGNNAAVLLTGSSSTGSGTWTTSGTGTFTPNPNTLNATYNPSAADILAGTVTLTLTSTNNGACAAQQDQMVITITPAPTVNAGPNQTVCSNNANVTLNASFTVSTGVQWSSSGTGIFVPSNTSNPVTYVPSASDTTLGTVTITVTTTGNGNCLAVTDQMIITITNAPLVNAGNSPVSVCANNPNVNLSGSSSTGSLTWSSSGTGSFSPNNTSPNTTYIPSAGDISAGSVTIVLTSGNNGNCLPVTDTVQVIITQPPTVNAGPDQTVCTNGPTVTLTGTSTTGSGSWSTSGTGTFTPSNNLLNTTYNPSPADLIAGTVTLTLTSTNNGGCLPVTDQMIVTIIPGPTANAGPDQSVCANNATVTLNGSFTVATGLQWSTPNGTGTFVPNNTTPNAQYVCSPGDTTNGTVTIVLTTTGNGICNPATDTMIITITNAPLVNAGNNVITCLSSPNTPLNGSSSTGSGTWTTLGCGTFTPNPNTPNATYVPCTADTAAGTVTLIFTSTNNGGCNPVSDTVVITYQNLPTVNAGSNVTVCSNNANVVLNGFSSTGTGIWSSSGTGIFSPNNTTLNATYIPSTADTTAGSVTLTLTSTNGCAPVSQSITITFTDAPLVNAGPDQTVCANNANTILNGYVGGGSSTGMWSTPNGTGSFVPNNTTLNATYVPSPADTTAGTVTLILTSTNNGTCNAVSDTMILTIISQPTAIAGPDTTVCSNNIVQLNGIILQGSGTGQWSTPNGTGTFVPNSTTLNAVYILSPGDTTNGTVTFILTSTNNGNCLASSDTMVVNIYPAPVVNAGPDQTVCANNAVVNLNGSVTGITTTGIWSTPNGTGTFVPNNTTLNASYIPSAADTTLGSITLVLSSTNNGGCLTVTDTMIITITDAPYVNAGPNIFICTGTMSAALNGVVGGGSSTGTWTTLGSGTFTPNPNSLNATYNLSTADSIAGTVTLILTSTNNGNCNAVSDTVVITVTSIPVVTAGSDTTICSNAPIVLNGNVVGGGGTGQWSTPNGTGTFTPSDTTLNATYVPSAGDIAQGTVTLILTATNSCLPVADTIVITILPGPVANAGNNVTVCGATPVNLSGSVSNATGGQWSSSGTGTFTPSDTVLNVTYTPSAADVANGSVYIFFTTTGNGLCSPSVDTLQIFYGAQPVANFVHGPACQGNAISFTDTSTVSNGTIVSWNWNFGTGTSSAQDTSWSFPNTGPQSVTLIVTSNAGCSDTITLSVYVNPNPATIFTFTTSCPDSAYFNDNSTISSGTVTGWAWSFGDSTFATITDPSHQYPDTGTYIVTLVVTSDSGCTAAYTDTVTIIPCAEDEFHGPAVPSAFTPNNDGQNDFLVVLGGPFKEMDFRVYNEWGNEIFRSSDQSVGWDGTYKGKKQPGGTYVWVLEGVTMDDNKFKLNGDVTIIR